MKPTRTVAVRFLAAVACGIASAVLGSTSAAADDGPDLAAIDRYVRSEMDAQRIPGLALGIVQGDRIVHVQGYGRAERSGRDVTPQTPFLIGSVTKSFTALAIMQLSEAGRVRPGCAGAAVPAVVAGRRSGRVDPDHGSPSALPGQRSVEGDRQRVRDQRGHPRLRPRGPGPGAARCRTHRAGGHDLAVQQRQLLDPGHDRAGRLGPVLRDLHPAAHLRPAADAQLLHVARPRRGRTACPLATATGTASPSPPNCPSIAGAWVPRASAPARRTWPATSASTSTVADTAPPRWSHPPVPPSCSGPGSPPAWTASRTRWAGTWARSTAPRRSPTTAAASTPTQTSSSSPTAVGASW